MMPFSNTQRSNARSLTTSLLIFILLSLLSVVFVSLLDRPMIPLSHVLQEIDATDFYVFYQLRLPKYILAFVVGASLSVSGVSFQALLKNPLADPYILGVSGGAALGYVIGIVIGLPFVLLPLFGFGAALLSLFVIYRMALVQGVLSATNLLLIGVIFNAFSFAVILVVNSIANFGQAHQILNLLLGSIETVPWFKVVIVAMLAFIAMCINWMRARSLDLLALGDEEAFHLGLDAQREKKIFFVTTSLLVGASVSLCGLIGFVGLIVPQIARLLMGANHQRVLPVSFFLGGLGLMLCEFVAANIVGFDNLATRIPVGAVTALIGAPVFVLLLQRSMMGKLRS